MVAKNKKPEPELENSMESAEKDAGPDRGEEASRIISKYVGWGAGAGAIPFPIWDIVGIATVQVKLIQELNTLYGVQFSESRARHIITVLAGSLSPQMLAGVTAVTLFKFVPFIGHALSAVTLPLLSSASAYAVGKVMVSHLEEGGDLSNFDADGAKEDFQAAFKEGQQKASAASAS